MGRILTHKYLQKPVKKEHLASQKTWLTNEKQQNVLITTFLLNP